MPPNLGLAPKCDMKHRLTNAKHRHRCKKEHSVAFRIRENAFLTGALPRTSLGELTTLPIPSSRPSRGHSSTYPTLLSAFCASILLLALVTRLLRRLKLCLAPFPIYNIRNRPTWVMSPALNYNHLYFTKYGRIIKESISDNRLTCLKLNYELLCYYS